MSISIEEFVAFFEAKKKGIYLCPVCASPSFSINTIMDAEAPKGRPIVFNLTAPGGQVGHPFLAITCDNCGHSDFFHQQRILDWLKARAEGQK